MTYYFFKIGRSLRGDAIDDEIRVTAGTQDRVAPYEEGKTYLLLLERYADAYTDGDRFFFACGSLLIPADSITPSGARTGKMQLYGEALTAYLKSGAAKEIGKNGFEAYVLDLLRDHPLRQGSPFIAEDDMEAVITQTCTAKKVPSGSFVSRHIHSDQCFLLFSIMRAVSSSHSW